MEARHWNPFVVDASARYLGPGAKKELKRDGALPSGERPRPGMGLKSEELFLAASQIFAAELGETARGSEHYQVLFSLGILLFLVTFVINLLADILVRKGKGRRA